VCVCVCVCFVCLQMAGNPDQQEDTLDDQYQEEVEDEVRNTHTPRCTFYIVNEVKDVRERE